ncbi:MAG: glycosyltransferase [Candidatus Omnitrophota bacterium]
MSASFSVLIPARNAAATLDRCLQAVHRSLLLPAEVLVIDDASTDPTSEIAKRYLAKILHVNLRAGPMPPRLAGALYAQEEILVFIDADVCVRPDTFQKVLRHFSDPGIRAVTGLLSANPGPQNFFSAFKNEYMHWIFHRQPEEPRFLYGSLFAVRKTDLKDFRPSRIPFGNLVSDTELALYLHARDATIRFDRTLEVDHLKTYDGIGLLKNDFVIPFSFAFLAWAYRDLRRMTKEFSFSHVRPRQLTSLLFQAAAWLSLTAPENPAWFLFPAFQIAYFLCWAPWLTDIGKRRGLRFTLACAFFLPLDSLCMLAGILTGSLAFGVSKLQGASA